MKMKVSQTLITVENVSSNKNFDENNYKSVFNNWILAMFQLIKMKKVNSHQK